MRFSLMFIHPHIPSRKIVLVFVALTHSLSEKYEINVARIKIGLEVNNRKRINIHKFEMMHGSRLV